jgi:signal transduction histidine kinase
MFGSSMRDDWTPPLCELGEDGQIEVSVNDTGPGLPLGKADQIFDSFLTEKPRGSGMSLAINKSIRRIAWRTDWANGDGGRSATFHIKLPVAVCKSNGHDRIEDVSK